MSTLNKKLIAQLSNGKIAVKNDGTLEELKQILKEAFPKDTWTMGMNGKGKIYIKYNEKPNQWMTTDATNLPLISVADFFEDASIPEKWCVKHSEEVGRYFNKKIDTNCYTANSERFNSGYMHRYNLSNQDILTGDGQGRSFYEPSIRKGCTEITIEQFREITNSKNMEKEIIGYRLIKPEYEEAARKIVDGPFSWTSEIIFKQNDDWYKKFKKAGVLDLWFAPVYEKEKPELPEINGYEGKLDGEKVIYGCAELHNEWFTTSKNRHIKSMALSSGVEINEEQMDQIRKVIINNIK